MKHSSQLPPPSQAEFATRRLNVLAEARRRGLDAVLIWGRGGTNVDGSADLLYLSNHLSPVSHMPDSEAGTARGHAALLIAEGIEPLLITDAYDIQKTDVAVDNLQITPFVDRDAGKAIAKAGLAGKRIGLVGNSGLLHSAYTRIVEAAGADTAFISAEEILTDLRMIKSDYEIDLLREASRIGSEWITTLLNAAIPGRTEGEIVGEGMRYICAAGGWAYDVAVSSGPVAARYRHRQALPTWDSVRPVEAGDMIHFDVWGPIVHGYFCDLVRSTVVGQAPDPHQARILEDAIAFVEHMIAGIEPGVPLSAIHQRGTEWLHRRRGGGSSFAAMVPHVGHSLGLADEPPFINKHFDRPIQPNMVLALEGFIADGPKTAAGFEQVVVVKESGLEIITTAPARNWNL